MEVEVEEQVDDELGLFLLSLVQGEEVSLVQGEEVSLDQGEEGDCTVVDVVSTSNKLKGFKNTFVVSKICSYLVFLSPDLLWFKY